MPYSEAFASGQKGRQPQGHGSSKVRGWLWGTMDVPIHGSPRYRLAPTITFCRSTANTSLLISRPHPVQQQRTGKHPNAHSRGRWEPRLRDTTCAVRRRACPFLAMWAGGDAIQQRKHASVHKHATTAPRRCPTRGGDDAVRNSSDSLRSHFMPSLSIK